MLFQNLKYEKLRRSTASCFLRNKQRTKKPTDQKKEPKINKEPNKRTKNKQRTKSKQRNRNKQRTKNNQGTKEPKINKEQKKLITKNDQTSGATNSGVPHIVFNSTPGTSCWAG